MTDTIEMLNVEVEALRSKNAELLGELKRAKTKATEATAEVEQLRTEVMDLKFNKPVAEMLEKVFTSKYAAPELGEHFKFELNEAGEIELRDLDGMPATVTETVKGEEVTRPVKFEQAEVWQFLRATGKFDDIIRSSGVTGGGASGSRQTVAQGAPSAPPTREPASAGFGLR